MKKFRYMSGLLVHYLFMLCFFFYIENMVSYMLTIQVGLCMYAKILTCIFWISS